MLSEKWGTILTAKRPEKGCRGGRGRLWGLGGLGLIGLDKLV